MASHRMINSEAMEGCGSCPGVARRQRTTPSRKLEFNAVMVSHSGIHLIELSCQMRIMIELLSSVLPAGELDEHLFERDASAADIGQVHLAAQQILDAGRLEIEHGVQGVGASADPEARVEGHQLLT